MRNVQKFCVAKTWEPWKEEAEKKLDRSQSQGLCVQTASGICPLGSGPIRHSEQQRIQAAMAAAREVDVESGGPDGERAG